MLLYIGLRSNISYNRYSLGLVVRVSGYGSWVRFPALPDFMRRSASGTGSTQPREDN
jgi:hypothetical protein